MLNQNNITRFNSISEINSFIKNYNSERNEIPKIVENAFSGEIKNLQSEHARLEKIYNELKSNISKEINNELKILEEKIKQTREEGNRNFIYKIINFFKTKKIQNEKLKLEKDFESIIRDKTRIERQKAFRSTNKLNEYFETKELIISDRCRQRYKEIDHTKEIVDGLYTLIAGAVGETAVVKELQNLPDSNVLINDFSMKFDPPIFNKKENDRIFSIQIDHLLICNAGIFILETKNWSKQSIESLDLRSPVKQITRTSFALFVLLNSESELNRIKLDRHHWGNKQIPVRNIVVMIHDKPKEKFKHVKILSLNELIGYITYFDPVFDDTEITSIADYLRLNKTDKRFDDFKCF